MSSEPASTSPVWATHFEQLVREHERALIAVALRLSGSRADACDLVQDTLERALRSFDKFTPGTNGRAWMLTILRHTFIDRCRRRSRDSRTDCIDDVQVSSPEPTERPVWDAVSSEELSEAVERLAEEFAVVYRLHAVESLSYQEIAERLGIPTNTVGTRLARARRKLRSMLTLGPQSEAQASSL
jgi:RNA polymerase sigma-70 factor (ECF subfamily)